MFQLIEFLKKRPSDLTIRVIRFLLTVAVVALLIVFKADYKLPFEDSFVAYKDYILYAFGALMAIRTIVMDVFGKCVFKRATVKKLQMICGLFLIILGFVISPVEVKVVTDCVSPQANCSISLDQLQSVQKDIVNVGLYLILIGLFALLGGATGKIVTEKCLKYGETIKKIRV